MPFRISLSHDAFRSVRRQTRQALGAVVDEMAQRLELRVRARLPGISDEAVRVRQTGALSAVVAVDAEDGTARARQASLAAAGAAEGAGFAVRTASALRRVLDG